MKYELSTQMPIVPIPGLDGVRGDVRIVGVLAFEGLPDYVDTDSWLQGLNESEAADLHSTTWYAFRYIDEENHAIFGVVHLPEELFEAMVDAAAAPIEPSRDLMGEGHGRNE